MNCKACQMPLDDDNNCQCDRELCYHCCACEPGCQCGCLEKE